MRIQRRRGRRPDPAGTSKMDHAPLEARAPANASASGADPMRSILLYETVAAGGFEVRAQFCGLVRRGEWPHHCTEEDAFGAEISAADDRRTAGEQVRIFGLQVAERRLRFLFASLRRNLDGIATACRCRRHRSSRGGLVCRRLAGRCGLRGSGPRTHRRGCGCGFRGGRHDGEWAVAPLRRLRS